MAKISYETLNKVKHTTLEDAKVGDVIKLDHDVYIVTNSYKDVKSNEVCYRGIMHTASYDFGDIEYMDESVDVEILEDAEIIIRC